MHRIPQSFPFRNNKNQLVIHVAKCILGKKTDVPFCFDSRMATSEDKMLSVWSALLFLICSLARMVHPSVYLATRRLAYHLWCVCILMKTRFLIGSYAWIWHRFDIEVELATVRRNSASVLKTIYFLILSSNKGARNSGEISLYNIIHEKTVCTMGAAIVTNDK